LSKSASPKSASPKAAGKAAGKTSSKAPASAAGKSLGKALGKALGKVAPGKAVSGKAVSDKALGKPAKTARKTSTPAAALKTQQPDADKTLDMILSRLDDMKAEATVTIDLRGKSAFSDYMVVTTGRANRHVGAIAENVTKALKENGAKSIHVEGLPNCDWVLIDSGDVIVHVFRPEVREFYNLERLWTQNPAAAKAI
jgi:ribosome-associated protein